MGIILILGVILFYLWRLFVFANAFNHKKHIEQSTNEYTEEVKPVKRYSIHCNIYE